MPQDDESSTILVEGLPLNVDKKRVQDFFSFCGDVKSVELTQDTAVGKTKATITFATKAAASTSLVLSNTNFEQNVITVSLAQQNGTQSQTKGEINEEV